MRGVRVAVGSGRVRWGQDGLPISGQLETILVVLMISSLDGT